ncbi:hypothetical protein HPB52_003571 [Rhipicephalus sanguineus]|uniref:Uncharacterized protein n=1 Tax=Rhipicephalus sanguineus TaxID=34632 RepID=A0A9D4PQG2_RHISA|nr:hypothetical protein HPB52_003571 [Rhipicephalus sanguineus]
MCRAGPTRKTTAAREARPRGRAGVGFPGVLFVLKGTTPCRRNPCVVGSSSSQNHWSSTRRPCVFRLRHGRRAGVGFPGVLFVLKGTTPCRRNPCVVGSSSSQNHWSSTRRPCVFRLRHGR